MSAAPKSAGISAYGTPLAGKLGVKPGMKIAVLDAPEGFDVGPAAGRLGGSKDMVIVFVTARRALERRLEALRRAVAPDGMVWVAWPKKASKVPTDMTEDVVREVVLPAGLVDVKVCAIDATWSGLKVVIRKELR
jgi:hypothetical protein